MRKRSALRGLPLAGTASAGVLVGHWLAYVAAVPATGLREHVLLASGHSWWLSGVRIAAALAVAGLATVLARHLRGTADAGPDGVASLARRLAVIQVAAFSAMEVVERLASGSPLGGLFQHHLFLLGLAAQVVVACAGAVFLRWFTRTASALAAAIHRPTPTTARGATVRAPRARPRPILLLAGAAGVRGPPSR